MADSSTIETPKEKIFFKRKQVKLALKALLAHLKSKAEQKDHPDLFNTAEGLWLVVAVAKIPEKGFKPILVELPHSVVSDKEVCLISSQPGKDVNEMFQEIGVDNVQKVISMTKLRKNYSTHALKRQLIASYDVFVCEDKLYPRVLKSLGKECYKRKKIPIPLKMKNKNWKEEINRCVNSSVMRIGHGTCSTLRVGSFGNMTARELFENIVNAMQTISKLIPGNEKNIKSVHLKSCNSIALPIFQANVIKTNKFTIPNKITEVPAKKRKRIRKEKKLLAEQEKEENSESEEKGILEKEFTMEVDTEQKPVGISVDSNPAPSKEPSTKMKPKGEMIVQELNTSSNVTPKKKKSPKKKAKVEEKLKKENEGIVGKASTIEVDTEQQPVEISVDSDSALNKELSTELRPKEEMVVQKLNTASNVTPKKKKSPKKKSKVEKPENTTPTNTESKPKVVKSPKSSKKVVKRKSITQQEKDTSEEVVEDDVISKTKSPARDIVEAAMNETDDQKEKDQNSNEDVKITQAMSARRKSRKVVEVSKVTPERKRGLRSYKAKTPATVTKVTK